LCIFTARRYAQARHYSCRPVSVRRPPVCPTHPFIVSKRQKMSSNLFLGLVAAFDDTLPLQLIDGKTPLQNDSWTLCWMGRL